MFFDGQATTPQQARYRAITLGKAAGCSGLALSNNPYEIKREQEQADWWFDGWMIGRRMRERKGLARGNSIWCG